MVTFGTADVVAMRECSERSSRDVTLRVMNRFKISLTPSLLSFTGFCQSEDTLRERLGGEVGRSVLIKSEGSLTRSLITSASI